MTEWDPTVGERIGPAWRRIVGVLQDGCWHPWNALIDEVTPDSGLLPTTVDRLLRQGVTHGYLIRRGTYRRGSKTDTRAVKWNSKVATP